jgi:predicted nucleic acid-binding protein
MAEYFGRRPRLESRELDRLDELIRDDLVGMVHPVRAEVLSGRVRREREAEIRAALNALRSLDLDWNASEVWDAIAKAAGDAREADAPAVGLVDRMIMLAAERAPASLWTLDRPLATLAQGRGVDVFAP